MRARVFALPLLLLTATTPLAAQQPPLEPTQLEDNTGRMLAGGIMGAVVGAAAGGMLGAALAGPGCRDSFCVLAPAGIGMMVGESLGIAAGVHLGNRSQGSFMGALAGPVLVGVGSMAAAHALRNENIPGIMFAVTVPTAQIGTAIAGEKAAMKRRANR